MPTIVLGIGGKPAKLVNTELAARLVLSHLHV
jgi:hypothetical protein